MTDIQLNVDLDPHIPCLSDKERIKLVEEICSSIQEEGTITEIRNVTNRSGYDD